MMITYMKTPLLSQAYYLYPMCPSSGAVAIIQLSCHLEGAAQRYQLEGFFQKCSANNLNRSAVQCSATEDSIFYYPDAFDLLLY